MNRKQRRAMGIKTRMPTITVTKEKYDADIEEARNKSTELSLILMLSIPVMVIHDKYSLLMKRNENGKSREERFFNLCMDYYESLKEGRVSFKDLIETVEEETGCHFIDSEIAERFKRGEKPW